MNKISSKIMLVDDSHMGIKMMSDLILGNGFESVVTRANAEEAIKYFEEDCSKDNKNVTVDLVITNLMLPGQSGLDLLKYLKASSRLQSIPVIIVTAFDDPTYLQQAFQYGAIDYIVRPCIPDVILRRIRSILEMKGEIQVLKHQHVTLKNEHERILADLKSANQLQSQLLPKSIVHEKVAIHGSYLPYDLLGGDLYYWSELGDGKIGIILIDVMGHGAATALVCMHIRSILPAIFDATADSTEIIKLLNQYIFDFNCQLASGSYHCTAFLLRIDTHRSCFEYINAGHPYAAYIRENDDIIWLSEGCIPLGIFEDFEIEKTTIDVIRGSKMVLYSDGIYDLLRSQKLDIHYILKYIQIYGQLEEDGQGLLKKVVNLMEQTERDDDISLVYIDFL